MTSGDLRELEGPARVLARVKGGTLLLDEITDIPDDIQARIVRMIDTPGDHVPRFMATSQGDLAEALDKGRLRQDLYYRLSGASIQVPSLRERVEDIALLTDHFLLRAERDGAPKRWLSGDAAELFRAYSWPGNVRQLENAVFRAVVLCDGDQLRPQDFPQISGQMPDVSNLPSSPFNKAPDIAEPVQSGENGPVAIQDEAGELRTLSDIERDILQYAIDFYEGHMSEVSRRLGIGRSTLYRKLSALGIDNAA